MFKYINIYYKYIKYIIHIQNKRHHLSTDMVWNSMFVEYNLKQCWLFYIIMLDQHVCLILLCLSSGHCCPILTIALICKHSILCHYQKIMYLSFSLNLGTLQLTKSVTLRRIQKLHKYHKKLVNQNKRIWRHSWTLYIRTMTHCLIACYSISIILNVLSFFPWGWFLVLVPCSQR